MGRAMSREMEDRLEEVLDELSWLANQDEFPEKDQGMLMAADCIVAKVLTRRQNARYMNRAYDGKYDG